MVLGNLDGSAKRPYRAGRAKSYPAALANGSAGGTQGSLAVLKPASQSGHDIVPAMGGTEVDEVTRGTMGLSLGSGAGSGKRKSEKNSSGKSGKVFESFSAH